MNNNERRRLLLVDDEQDITFTISIGLEDNGFVVDSFNDPLLALQSFKEKKEKENQPYALALLDVKMPKMNGFDLYNEMRKIDDKIKACFITAFDIQEHEIAYIVGSQGSIHPQTRHVCMYWIGCPYGLVFYA